MNHGPFSQFEMGRRATGWEGKKPVTFNPKIKEQKSIFS